MKLNKHIPVLLDETINSLKIIPDGIYVDGTLGRGGHAMNILKRLNANGKLICIDQDPDSIDYCHKLFKEDARVTIVKDNFSNLSKILLDLKVDLINGLLLDLGVSSPQLDNSERGFSYNQDGPLDMRMNPEMEIDAKMILNNYSENQLINIFKEYGEIRNPRSLVRSIIKTREIKSFETTFDFLNLLKSCLPKQEIKKKRFANIYFQAIRIAVNNELECLKKILNDFDRFISIDGIVSIITFHSLEDKLVVKKFKELSANRIPKEIPINIEDRKYCLINPKGIIPSELEQTQNFRSKSSKLRVIQKLKNE